MPGDDGFRSVADINLDDVLEGSENFFEAQPYSSPADWGDEVLYFLLPDRFSDGTPDQKDDPNGRPLFNPATDTGNAMKAYKDPNTGTSIDADTASARWRDAGTEFVGGTIKGLQHRLAYLKGLGVTAIWVGPMFKQVKWDIHSYHGYGIQDFLELDEHFGVTARDDLRNFVKEAHKSGIRVILDIILNHSGDVFAYKGDTGDGMKWNGGQIFDVDYFRGPERHTRNDFKTYPKTASLDIAVWPLELQNLPAFTRKGKISNYNYFPEYFDGDFDIFKDVNLGQNNVEGFIPTNALETLCTVYKYWIAFADIDGYRIDTVKHMGQGPTRYFCSAIHEYAESIGKSNFFLVGEVLGGRDYAFETVQLTGLNAALGIGGDTSETGDDIQDHLEYLSKGLKNPPSFFDLFRNSRSVGVDSHTWFRNKVVTMIDDHDQVRKGAKARFCADDRGTNSSILSALGFNLCTLGIPCIYYGSEQSFDGRGFDSKQSFKDRWIREAMFGGKFGAFRSRDVHFFNDTTNVYVGIKEIARVRSQELALRHGRQYLREISGNGTDFGVPTKPANNRMLSIVPWSRIFSSTEILCAINTDSDNNIQVWVTVDRGLHRNGDRMRCLYSTAGTIAAGTLVVQDKNGRAVVQLTVPKGGFVIYK
jgi:glycosidase